MSCGHQGVAHSSLTQTPVLLLHLATSCPTLGNLNPPKIPCGRSPAPLCPSSPGYSRGHRKHRTESSQVQIKQVPGCNLREPEAQALAPGTCGEKKTPLFRPPPTWLLCGGAQFSPQHTPVAGEGCCPGTPHSCSNGFCF